MKNAKALLLVSLLSVSGLVVADECCKSVCGTEEVVACKPEACKTEVCCADACQDACKKDKKATKADVLEIAQNDAAPEVSVEAEVQG